MAEPTVEPGAPIGRAGNDSVRSAGPRTFPEVAYRGIFLAFVAAVSGFGREFAHLHVTVAGLPLFSGEITLALLAVLGAVHLWKGRGGGLRVDGAVIAIVAFLVVGCAYAVVGLGRGFGVAALRDFAIVYYAALFILTLVYLRCGGTPTAIVLALVAGVTVGAAWTLARFVAAPSLSWGHGASGQQAIVAWVALLGAALLRFRPGARAASAGRMVAIVCCAAVVFLSAYRTMLLVMVGVSLAAVVLLRRASRASRRRALAPAVTGVLLWGVAVLVVATVAPPAAGPRHDHGPMAAVQALQAITIRWADLGLTGLNLVGRWSDASRRAPAPTTPPAPASAPRAAPTPASAPRAAGTPPSGQARADGVAKERAGRRAAATPAPAPPRLPTWASERSYNFRVSAWWNAVKRIATAPLLGIGFGPAPNLFPDRHCELITSPTSNCGNAHNTFLTVAMRMGIPLLVAFLLFNAIELRRALRALKRATDPRPEALLVFSLAALVSLGIYAALSLFLESPYLASLYWIILALLHEVGAGARQAPLRPAGQEAIRGVGEQPDV